ncbi:FAD-dependent monooxygenase [Actinomadura oligospora]|uniref:FAD-dependent monooxygenase n=1 Tax=Actinomadura oligospora TaxID=111804 RepID=UPI000478D236|nr:FAD-dependent monooxygenase [Actinomadura oligospora]
MTKVLISGASIAGPTLAYWLDRYGFEVTVVERAGGFRPGGQAIDVRGTALGVAERMGVLDEVRAHATNLRGMSIVDGDGNELHRSEEHTLSGGPLDSPDVELLRDDLSDIIVKAAGDRIEYVFGDSIASLEDGPDGVHVTFEKAEPRTFDLVVGADGVHSTTRRLVFGADAGYVPLRAAAMAVWTMPNVLGLDRWQIGHFSDSAGTSGAMVMTVRDNTELRAYAMFENQDGPLPRDVAEQKRLLAGGLADASWEVPRLLEHMWDAKDFHYDALAQVRLDRWSHGRVVLLGDAGYCGSPASGQGTSMAMVGAYVLAGELKAADGDHGKAFAVYEDELRDWVEANQAFALRGLPDEGADVADLVAESAAGLTDDFAALTGSYILKDY